MMWAILIYATLVYPSGEVQRVISWNLPFRSYEQCEAFYRQEEDTLQKGVIAHGQDVYHPDIQLLEMGCAKGQIQQAGAKPIVSGEKRLYFRGEST